MCKIHHPKADIDRLYVKMKKGETCYKIKRNINRDNQYCRIFENKTYRREVCKYFQLSRKQSTKYELIN
jgi:hypothetical protein